MANHGGSFVFITLAILATILLIFAMRTFAAARLARTGQDQAAEWQRLTAEIRDSQARSAAQLDEIKAESAEIRTRLASIETILRAVE